jgi:ankyrin repeat protein
MTDYVSLNFELSCAIEDRNIARIEQVFSKEQALLNAICLGDDQTPLAYACMLGYVDVVTFLIEKGADVNGRMSRDGYTALFWAAKSNQIEAVKTLLNSGAKANILTYQGEDIIDVSYDDDGNELTEMREYLIEYLGEQPYSYEV